jgi:hypothetical protein
MERIRIEAGFQSLPENSLVREDASKTPDSCGTARQARNENDALFTHCHPEPRGEGSPMAMGTTHG